MADGERIRKARANCGISQTELAADVGVSKQTLYKYEKNIITNIPSNIIENIARCTGVSPEYLMGWDDAPADHNVQERMSDAPLDVIKHFNGDMKKVAEFQNSVSEDAAKELSNIISFEPEDLVPIPVIGKVAAGYTCLAEMNVESFELVSKDCIISGYEYVYLRVIGDSMEPLLMEDDLVLVRVQETVEDGDYAVVIVDNEDGVVKKINFGRRGITLNSINPYYPPREFVGAETDRVKFFGKVVESKRKY